MNDHVVLLSNVFVFEEDPHTKFETGGAIDNKGRLLFGDCVIPMHAIWLIHRWEGLKDLHDEYLHRSKSESKPVLFVSDEARAKRKEEPKEKKPEKEQ
ncbi:MAG: hypothetical protein N0E59_02135 [Candidatus Thiodiazotropha taylori]|nr:hypothetical protein [Candidatus Thiodiazotropha taylori]MCG8051905.1 hypothetical protein [Candidatus Thiodiazotropha taylori]MCG8108677.1 hypothetical protein [Candidatus Thiodiazotropha taylori]MCG8109541.1 hypothetical protein [Candidatus Thiodiazotropha taylori]MCW4281013.1 hypothetical protein [Candidatus Thiodiazotropha taylori]